MRRWSLLIALFLVLLNAGCGGSGNNLVNNVGLYGDWNVAMYPTGSTTPVYVFGLAMSQEGANNYSGGSIAYTGGVGVPSNMCINSSALTAVGSTSGNNFTMTVTDSTSETVITVNGTLATQNGSSLSGTYNNPASRTCSASRGTISMVPQE